MSVEHTNLLVFVCIVWCLWIVAGVLQNAVEDIRSPRPKIGPRGFSPVPVIPVAPLALWGIAWLIDREIAPWGSIAVAALHGLFGLALCRSILADIVRMKSATKNQALSE